MPETGGNMHRSLEVLKQNHRLILRKGLEALYLRYDLASDIWFAQQMYCLPGRLLIRGEMHLFPTLEEAIEFACSLHRQSASGRLHPPR
jgi:hypothetical protein